MVSLKLNSLIDEKIIASYQESVNKINDMINLRQGAGNDYLGWADWPLYYDREEVAKMIKEAKYVRENFDILVVCGIGGSYLGARAALEALNGL